MNVSLDQLEKDFYIGHINEPCPYLPDRSSNLYVLPGNRMDGLPGVFYRQLLDRGYRRSGDFFYRPDCSECQECKVIRVEVEHFQLTKSQKRIKRKGAGVFTHETGEPEYTDEKEALYRRYLSFQHRRESSLDPHGYKSFFVNSATGIETRELRLYYENRLAAVGIIDIAGNVLSSVYFFFDPEISRYSPGVYSVLLEIDLIKKWGLRYYYPGFYIAQNDSMNYKSKYSPAWILTPGQSSWEPVTAGDKGD